MDRLIRITELAELLGMTEQAVRTAICRQPHKIPPYVKHGGSIAWRESDYSKWIANLKPEAEKKSKRRGRPTLSEQMAREAAKPNPQP
jgi:predicted DNA-binding transcriptional regulator AlpA